MDKPWETEPSGAIFTFDDGCVGVIRRAPLQHLCGYVGVPKEHHYHGVDYMDYIDVDVHGGVTFSKFLGESDHWFIGFDCAHYTDYVPGIPELNRNESLYKDFDFVTAEVHKLHDQLCGPKALPL